MKTKTSNQRLKAAETLSEEATNAAQIAERLAGKTDPQEEKAGDWALLSGATGSVLICAFHLLETSSEYNATA